MGAIGQRAKPGAHGASTVGGVADIRTAGAADPQTGGAALVRVVRRIPRHGDRIAGDPVGGSDDVRHGRPLQVLDENAIKALRDVRDEPAGVDDAVVVASHGHPAGNALPSGEAVGVDDRHARLKFKVDAVNDLVLEEPLRRMGARLPALDPQVLALRGVDRDRAVHVIGDGVPSRSGDPHAHELGVGPEGIAVARFEKRLRRIGDIGLADDGVAHVGRREPSAGGGRHHLVPRGRLPSDRPAERGCHAHRAGCHKRESDPSPPPNRTSCRVHSVCTSVRITRPPQSRFPEYAQRARLFGLSRDRLQTTIYVARFLQFFTWPNGQTRYGFTLPECPVDSREQAAR